MPLSFDFHLPEMHHALEIQEILSSIFGHLHRYVWNMAALARTCRAFKEPALDRLWEKLDNLSVVVRYLPEAYRLRTK